MAPFSEYVFPCGAANVALLQYEEPDYFHSHPSQPDSSDSTSHDVSTSPGEECFPFMRLAPELRDMVYGLLVVSKHAIYPSALMDIDPQRKSTITAALFQVSREVRIDALRVFYAHNTTVFCHGVHRRFQMDMVHSMSTAGRALRPFRKTLSDNFHRSVFRRFSKIHIKVNWLFTDLEGGSMVSNGWDEFMALLESSCCQVFGGPVEKWKIITFTFMLNHHPRDVRNRDIGEKISILSSAMVTSGLPCLLANLSQFRTIHLEHTTKLDDPGSEYSIVTIDRLSKTAQREVRAAIDGAIDTVVSEVDSLERHKGRASSSDDESQSMDSALADQEDVPSLQLKTDRINDEFLFCQPHKTRINNLVE